MTKPKITAVIPARGGSRRLPDKNLAPFNGTTLLIHKIRQLKKVPQIDEIVVSSDCYKIIDSVQREGVTVHVRPPEYCDEKSQPWGEVVKHICENIDGEHIVWAHCTSPLVDEALYSKALKWYEKMAPKQCDSLMTIEEVRRYIFTSCDGLLVPHYETGVKEVPSQELRPFYVSTWGIAIAPRLKMIEWKYQHGPYPYRMILDKRASVDVDDALDLACAEAWLKVGNET